MPNPWDEKEKVHKEMLSKLQAEPISEEDVDALLEMETGEGFEHAASAEELRHGLGGHHEASEPTKTKK